MFVFDFWIDWYLRSCLIHLLFYSKTNTVVAYLAFSNAIMSEFKPAL